MFYIWAVGFDLFSSSDLSHRTQWIPLPLTQNLFSVWKKVSHILWHHDFMKFFWNEKMDFFLYTVLLNNLLRLWICYKWIMMPPSKAFLKEGQFFRHIWSLIHVLVFCQFFRVACFDFPMFYYVPKYFSLSRYIIWFCYL